MSMDIRPGFADIRDDPSWYLGNIDIPGQKAIITHFSESHYRAVSFLDERGLTADSVLYEYQLQEFQKNFCNNAPGSNKLGFIFHIGHCGSTLLSRALAASNAFLPLREPLPIRTLADYLRNQENSTCELSSADWEKLASTVLSAMSRRFNDAQLPIIKATSTCNNLIHPLLAENAERKAILLFIPLDRYLATILSSDMGLRDARIQAASAEIDWKAMQDQGQVRLSALQPAEIISLEWLSNMAYFLRAKTEFPSQVYLLDFEGFLSDYADQLKKLCRFLGRSGDSEILIAEYLSIAGRYSKRPKVSYSASAREARLALARTNFDAPIRVGMGWAESRISETPWLATVSRFLRH